MTSATSIWMFIFIAVVFIAMMVVCVRIYRHPIEDQPDVWYANLERAVADNENWRNVLATTDNLQVVAMSTPPGESLGWEVHRENDQFFRIESGEAVLSVAKCDGDRPVGDVTSIPLSSGMAAIVPRGMCHNVRAVTPVKMYTVYGPKHHPAGTIHRTHADEVEKNEYM